MTGLGKRGDRRMMNQKQTAYLKEWQGYEGLAEQMLPIIGRLYRDHNVVTTVYGRSLVNTSTIDILKAHRFARLILDGELTVVDTFPILEEVGKLDLAPARIDIGRLAIRYQAQAGQLPVDEFLRRELAPVNTGRVPLLDEPRDIVLYGFGRIGRLLARILIEKAGSGEKLRIRRRWSARGAPETWQNGPASCVVTLSTASSTASSPSTKRKTPSSPTEHDPHHLCRCP